MKLQSITRQQIAVIQSRIVELDNALNKKLVGAKEYKAMSESDKIPFRIDIAEIKALSCLMFGEDTQEINRICIQNEYYCMAEGVKRAEQWAETQPMLSSQK